MSRLSYAVAQVMVPPAARLRDTVYPNVLSNRVHSVFGVSRFNSDVRTNGLYYLAIS